MKNIITFVLVCSAFVSFAQSNKEAQKLLNQVESNTKSYKTQTITFVNIIDAPTGNEANPRSTRTTSGTAYVKGQKFRIELGGIIFLNDGKKTYIIYPDDEEINAFQGDENEMNLTPSSILSTYKKGFSYAMAGKETVDGKSIQYIRLKPKAAADVKEIVIGVDTKTNQLYSFAQHGHDGIVTTFKVKSYKVNTTLADDFFSLKSAEFSGFELFEE